MRYAKLVDNCPQYAPRKIRIDDTVVYNPPEETLLSLGYKPVVYAERPTVEVGYYAQVHWTETDNAIEQSWTVEPVEQEL